MYIVLFLSIVSLALTSGCALNKATGYQSPNFKAKNISTLYVVQRAGDERQINMLIKTELEKYGYVVNTGSEDSVPKQIDGLVTYIDRWVWDFSDYMMELSVFIKDPKDGFPISNGYSVHTSLTRLSAEEMVEEVVANVLGKEVTRENNIETNN